MSESIDARKVATRANEQVRSLAKIKWIFSHSLGVSW